MAVSKNRYRASGGPPGSSVRDRENRETDLHNGLKFLVAASIEQIDLRTLDVALEEVDPPRVRATTKLREGNHTDQNRFIVTIWFFPSTATGSNSSMGCRRIP
jgi:hypothetical protein